jgi:hypothetical protein
MQSSSSKLVELLLCISLYTTCTLSKLASQRKLRSSLRTCVFVGVGIYDLLVWALVTCTYSTVPTVTLSYVQVVLGYNLPHPGVGKPPPLYSRGGKYTR